MAWAQVLTEAIAPLINVADYPQEAIAGWVNEAFSDADRPILRLWIEATDLAMAGDNALSAAIARQEQALLNALSVILQNGNQRGFWNLPDPQASAVRLSALHDGLAGRLLAGSPSLTEQQARAHLIAAFQLEGGRFTPGQ